MSVRSNYTDSLNFYGKETPQGLMEKFGSPLYVYNEVVLRERCRDLVGLCKTKGLHINYSAKANANPHLLKIIREEGCLVDAMSPGELYLDLKAGYKPDEVLYVCNNVSPEEMKNALEKGVLVSVDSLMQVEQLCRLNRGGKIMVRFNPGIGAGHSAKVVTGGKETKFGVDPEKLPQLLEILDRYGVTLAGINHHIGSLFMEGESYIEAAKVLLDLALKLPCFEKLEIIDFGGGFGIPYHKYENQARFDLETFSRLLNETLSGWAKAHNYHGKFYLEPGRYIAAECGVVLGTVYNTKTNGTKPYVGTDLGFNVLARPMLYDSFHDVEIYRNNAQENMEELEQTIVGNICESGDIIAKNRVLPVLREGDIVAMLDAGAYGFSMSSNYTQRLRPAEVLIQKDGTAKCIRRRDTFEDIFATVTDF
ncbi:diaminopimelate decarboxylase [Taurinivorans muris]|uniref:Diaminopimelate decarboxylase n=1 Tax=Taurinivorans muris TaxID=2787751 RepID=A0ABY5Y369_9BACT|nr:diaminopimelate decarboxylase [Desulfovibrionaceae bacterium LT0009]